MSESDLFEQSQADRDGSLIDDDLLTESQYNGLEDVMKKVIPFLKEQNEDSLAKLQSLLEKCNVKNLSEFALLQQPHFTDELFPLVNFLRMKKSFGDTTGMVFHISL